MAHVYQLSGQSTGSSPSSSKEQTGPVHDKRKTKCDPGLPRCIPCERTNSRCEYFDSSKNLTIQRAYISSLQSSLKRLQAELAALENEEKHIPDAETMIRGAGMIKFNEQDEYRFLGPSSGIAITRLVMELAKQSTVNKSIREVVPDVTAREIKQKFDDESGKPTSKVYPLISSVAAPQLPTHDLMVNLVDIYMAKAQYMLPLLHEPTFRQQIETVYHGSTDATLNFQLRLVLAISMQKLDTQYAGLADSYYLAALPYLESAVRRRDLSTLQSLALIAQYSTVTPTRTASYWVVGLAARLSQELGLCDERTIKEWPHGTRANTLEVDMRRRLFWIITSMEYGLAHTLGRPSAFGITVDHIDVDFFELCDDRFITPAGLLPGHRPVMKKCSAIHFFRMRLLQAEIRRTLYLKKRDSPLNDQDPWFTKMQRKLDHWVATCPKNDEGSGLSESWFRSRRNTMVVFLYRPSPQVPEPSEQAAEKCFDASIRNVEIQSYQIANKSVDLTWIFTQALFMALNTILWSLSYHVIRQKHPIDEVQTHLKAALEAINHTSERWPGVQSALQLYEKLIQSCLKAYLSDESFVVQSMPSAHDAINQFVPASSTSPAASSQAAQQSPRSHRESCGESSTDYQNTLHSSPNHSDYFGQSERDGVFRTPTTTTQTQNQDISPQQSCFQPSFKQSPVSPTSMKEYGPYSVLQAEEIHGIPIFDPSSINNALPSTLSGFPQWNPAFGLDSSQSAFPGYNDMAMDTTPWLASIGDEYSSYMHQAYHPPQRMQSLSQQQQVELMAALEQDQLPDVSGLASDATTFYSGKIL